MVGTGGQLAKRITISLETKEPGRNKVKLKDKVAIITCGGHGMGREMALAFAEEGANVVLAARTQSEIEAVAQELRTLGRKALAIPADVSIEEQVNRMVQKTIDEFGKVDILVNNAGGSFGARETMICDLSLSDWRYVLDVNLTGAFLCSRAVLQHMIEQKSGVIINITAGMGQRGKGGMGALSAAKFALEGLTQAMARELVPFNIRVNALKPGEGSLPNRPTSMPTKTAAGCCHQVLYERQQCILPRTIQPG